MSRRDTTIVLVAALAVAIAADLVVDATWPGRIALFGLAAATVLVLGAKWIGAAVISRPAGTRVGEAGDPRDDLAEAAPWEDRRA